MSEKPPKAEDLHPKFPVNGAERFFGLRHRNDSVLWNKRALENAARLHAKQGLARAVLCTLRRPF